MQHTMFQTRTFAEGQHSVVGGCNGFSMEERWEQETPVFARAIARHVDPTCRKVLDYGCGVGRIAKVLLELCEDIEVVGIDTSEHQLVHAKRYVASPRFRPMLPHHLDRRVDLVYSVYVLQHVPAIDLRETIQRLHFSLREGGRFIYCSSDVRMAIRFDAGGFFDDRCLGVDVREELQRYFEPIEELFSPADRSESALVEAMVSGTRADGQRVIAHPAIVYEKRALRGLWCMPYLARKPDGATASETAAQVTAGASRSVEA